MKHCSSNPYPLPGMTSSGRNNNSFQKKKAPTPVISQRQQSPPQPRPRSRRSSSRDSLDFGLESPSSVTIAPGLTIEGFAEDL